MNYIFAFHLVEQRAGSVRRLCVRCICEGVKEERAAPAANRRPRSSFGRLAIFPLPPFPVSLKVDFLVRNFFLFTSPSPTIVCRFCTVSVTLSSALICCHLFPLDPSSTTSLSHCGHVFQSVFAPCCIDDPSNFGWAER